MERSQNNESQDNLDLKERSNINLIYTFTESVLKTKIDSLNKLDIRLAAFLAFSGGLLKIVLDLPGKIDIKTEEMVCITCQLFKIGAGVSEIVTIIITTIALRSNFTGRVAAPQELTKPKWYYAEKNEFKRVVVKQWLETIEEIETLALKKSKALNRSITLIAAGGIIYGLVVILIAVYK